MEGGPVARVGDKTGDFEGDKRDPVDGDPGIEALALAAASCCNFDRGGAGEVALVPASAFGASGREAAGRVTASRAATSVGGIAIPELDGLLARWAASAARDDFGRAAPVDDPDPDDAAKRDRDDNLDPSVSGVTG